MFLLGTPSLMASGQDSVKLTPEQVALLKASDEVARKWIDQQTTPGIRMDSATMYFDDEVKRIVADTVYRDSIYRQPYTFIDVRDALQKANIRLAFWQMINLYPKYKPQVLKYITAYDKAIEAERLVNSAFYTYAMLDPRITKIEDGKPQIYRPDILEELLHNANEISAYVLTERAKKKRSK